MSTEPVDNNKGVCEWNQPLQLKSNFALPADPDQVPDLIIYLMAVSVTPCREGQTLEWELASSRLLIYVQVLLLYTIKRISRREPLQVVGPFMLPVSGV